jgi:hypothetical protein
MYYGGIFVSNFEHAAMRKFFSAFALMEATNEPLRSEVDKCLR